MSNNTATERMSDLRDRAHHIYDAAKADDSVPETRVSELRQGLKLIEMEWTAVESISNPAEVAPFDLEARLDEWEAQFDERERELGIHNE